MMLVMVTVHLHGSLGKAFGGKLRMAVHSPAEAVRAMVSQLDGFGDHVERRLYQVYRGPVGRGRDNDPQELHIQLAGGERDIHFVPRARGSKERGVGKILLGGLLIAASFVIPGSWAILGQGIAGLAGNIGVAMVLGGVSQMLAPGTPDRSDEEQPKSDLFGGALNVTTPNAAIPVIAGTCEVGSVVVSAAIHIEDRAGNES
ncbi:MAG: tail assembly protein [Rhodobacteraceae bacterium]|nr:tail assembly protein [Paracoccaceae bacterium]